MPEAKRPEISKSTGTDIVHERRKANPDSGDLTDAEEVWRSGETNPAADENGTRSGSGGRGRVADAGDVGQGQPSPYSGETQADAVARQSSRRDEPRPPEKPKQ